MRAFPVRWRGDEVSEADREPSDRSSEEPAASERSSLAADHDLTRGFVESVNHHVRTPLTGILGHAELLIDREHELPPEMHRSLALLLRAGHRLKDVVAGICDLVDVASLDPQAVHPVNVSELVADELAACRDRADQRGILAVASGDVGAVCVAESRRLRRALRELLDNALTYAPDRSTVRVTVATVPTGVSIEVCDQGDGIDPADRDRLVRPFERGTNPRQPSAGCGMGLALVTAVAASHRGRLHLSEGPGGGLRARLEIPSDLARPERPSSIPVDEGGDRPLLRRATRRVGTCRS
jgi:signal transduction histidine kinase